MSFWTSLGQTLDEPSQLVGLILLPKEAGHINEIFCWTPWSCKTASVCLYVRMSVYMYICDSGSEEILPTNYLILTMKVGEHGWRKSVDSPKIRTH